MEGSESSLSDIGAERRKLLLADFMALLWSFLMRASSFSFSLRRRALRSDLDSLRGFSMAAIFTSAQEVPRGTPKETDRLGKRSVLLARCRWFCLPNWRWKVVVVVLALDQK